jgi:hypothetical protein
VNYEYRTVRVERTSDLTADIDGDIDAEHGVVREQRQSNERIAHILYDSYHVVYVLEKGASNG